MRRASVTTRSTPTTTATVAVAALVVTLVAAPPAAAADVRTATVTRDGLTVTLSRVATPRTPVTGTGPTRSDFDGDGVDDVAGTALAADGSETRPGIAVVVVRYSSTPATDHLTTDVSAGGFGSTLVAADLDGDRYEDLVIGNPQEQLGSGGVWVVPGGPGGLDLDRTVHLDQDSPGMPGASEPGDGFAQALAAGDLTGDGRDDLAVGAPDEDLAGADDAGTVTVVRGSARGVTTRGALLVHQDRSWVPGAAEAGDRFGAAVAIGRADRGTRADVVVGTPFENDGAGQVTLLRGAARGVADSGATSVTGAAVTGRSGRDLSVQHLGREVVVADTDGDGLGEVVVGVPLARVGTTTPGAVVVLAGRPTGLSARGVRVVHQGTPGVPGVGEDGDCFGATLAAGDVTGDGRADVLVGAPCEGLGGDAGAGAVVLLRGSPDGLGGAGAQSWNQGSPGVPGARGAAHVFGGAAALLNLDGRGALDAAVGAAGDRLAADPADVAAGSVTTFTGGARGLTPRSRWTGAAFRTDGLPYQDAGLVLQGYGTQLSARNDHD